MHKKAYYTITLTVVSLLASIGVSSTFILTKNKIKEKELAVRTEALYAVLPGLAEPPEEITPSKTADQGHIYKGRNKAGQLIGYAACGEAQGYSSRIKVMVGIDSDLKKILGINVLSQNETPGLGTKMMEIESSSTLWSMFFGNERKSVKEKDVGSQQSLLFHESEQTKNSGILNEAGNKTMPWFQEQFKLKTLNQLVISKVKDPEKITAITGATISSKAVMNAVQNATEKIRNIIQPQDWEIK